MIRKGFRRGFELPTDGMGQFRGGAQVFGCCGQSERIGFLRPIGVVGGMVIVVPDPVLEEFADFLGFAAFRVVLTMGVSVIMIMVVVVMVAHRRHSL
jgi:hypothetical protein